MRARSQWFAIMVVSLGLLLGPSGAMAQEDAHHAEDSTAHDGGEHKHKNAIAFFGGALTDTKHDDTGPAFGVEYARLVAPRLYVAGLLEFASTELERETVLLGVVAFYPNGKFRMAAGLGAEFDTERASENGHGPEDDHGPEARSSGEGDETSSAAVVRLGTGYRFSVGSRYEIIPEFNVDFVGGDNSRTSLVYGVTFGIGF